MRLNSKLRKFLRDQSAAATVEFVAIFMLFIVFLMMVVDAMLLYYNRTELFTLSRDAARRVAIGALHPSDVAGYVQDKSTLGRRMNSAASYQGNVVLVETTVSLRDASVFGFYKPIVGDSMTVRVELLREPTKPPVPSGTS